jgi:hypothetical protein
MSGSADGREPPQLPGFEQEGENWTLRLDYYESFIEEVTGVDIDGDLSRRQLKTIQSRLEGCLEGYNRNGSCLCEDIDRYEHVESMETIHELSRFFRILVARRIEDAAPIEA